MFVKTGRDLTGRARIAHELGVSERTASRWRQKGILEVKQFGGRTSAWRTDAKMLDGCSNSKAKPRQR